jgi:hypothetical protein
MSFVINDIKSKLCRRACTIAVIPPVVVYLLCASALQVGKEAWGAWKGEMLPAIKSCWNKE